jgi:flagellar motor switch protein FliN
MSDPLTTTGLARALLTEVGSALGAGSGKTLAVTAAAAPAGASWGTSFTASGLVDGSFTLWIDEAGVRAIATRMTGLDEAPEPGVALDMLRELWRQAASAMTSAPAFTGLTLIVGTPETGTRPLGEDGLALVDGTTVLATVSVTGSVTRSATSAGAHVATPSGSGRSRLPGNLAALLDVDLPLVVRFARTEMPLRALAQLGPGSMVDMGRSPDAPVQVLVGAQVVAEGEVVVVSGNYGVRITSLVSPADRLKAIEL